MNWIKFVFPYIVSDDLPNTLGTFSTYLSGIPLGDLDESFDRSSWTGVKVGPSTDVLVVCRGCRRPKSWWVETRGVCSLVCRVGTERPVD